MRSTVVFIGGTTFFASVRKFTKEVGRNIYGYFCERRQNRIKRALEELMLHRNAIQNRKREFKSHLLKRRNLPSKILQKQYENGRLLTNSLESLLNNMHRCLE